VAVRARKGDEIICACGRAVGTFRNDLKDGAIISGRDIAITLPAGALDDRNRYLCPDCKKVVARHLGDQWIVLTRQGWL
jgi:acetone carboxylase gamma subunit